MRGGHVLRYTGFHGHDHLVLALLCGALHGETVLVGSLLQPLQDPRDVGWIGESISESLHDSLTSENVLVLDREDRLEGLPPPVARSPARS